MLELHWPTFNLENRSNRCSGGVLSRVLGWGTPQNLPCCVHAFVCVWECDSREQLSAGRCTQRGAIRHGGVTHIKDTHTHTHAQPWNFPFCCQCAMITIKPRFFSIGFSMAIVTCFSQCGICNHCSNEPIYSAHIQQTLFTDKTDSSDFWVKMPPVISTQAFGFDRANVCNSVSISICGDMMGVEEYTACWEMRLHPNTQLAVTRDPASQQLPS